MKYKDKDENQRLRLRRKTKTTNKDDKQKQRQRQLTKDLLLQAPLGGVAPTRLGPCSSACSLHGNGPVPWNFSGEVLLEATMYEKRRTKRTKTRARAGTRTRTNKTRQDTTKTMTMAMAMAIPVAETHLRALPGEPPFPRHICCVPEVQFLWLGQELGLVW
jgi:hypothetical protein